MNTHIASDSNKGTMTRIRLAGPSPKAIVAAMIGIRARERLADSRKETSSAMHFQPTGYKLAGENDA